MGLFLHSLPHCVRSDVGSSQRLWINSHSGSCTNVCERNKNDIFHQTCSCASSWWCIFRVFFVPTQKQKKKKYIDIISGTHPKLIPNISHFNRWFLYVFFELISWILPTHWHLLENVWECVKGIPWTGPRVPLPRPRLHALTGVPSLPQLQALLGHPPSPRLQAWLGCPPSPSHGYRRIDYAAGGTPLAVTREDLWNKSFTSTFVPVFFGRWQLPIA